MIISPDNPSILTEKLIKTYDSIWDDKKVPVRIDNTMSYKHRNYFIELKRVLNVDRKQRGLHNIASLMKYIHRYYDGNLRAFYLDLLTGIPYSVELNYINSDILRQISKKGINKTKNGYVYLVINHKFKNWCKFGMTTNLDKRLSSYQTADPDRGFEFYRTWHVDDRVNTEIELFIEFEKRHLTIKNEWLNTKPKKAADIIKHYLRDKDALLRKRADIIRNIKCHTV